MRFVRAFIASGFSLIQEISKMWGSAVILDHSLILKAKLPASVLLVLLSVALTTTTGLCENLVFSFGICSFDKQHCGL